MKFIIGDILDEKVDGLISSGNIYLNMSGGINGALMMKYGTGLQDELHDSIKHLNPQHVDPGHVHTFTCKIGDYKSVVYAVAIDGWYESNIDLVTKTPCKAADLLIADGCASIALGAIATGFGKLSKTDFGLALYAFEQKVSPEVDLLLVERNEYGMEEIKSSYEKAMGESDV